MFLVVIKDTMNGVIDWQFIIQIFVISFVQFTEAVVGLCSRKTALDL